MGSFPFLALQPQWLGTVISAGIILFATWLAGHFAHHALKHMGESEKTPLPAGSILGNIARVAIYIVGIGALCNVCFNYDLTGFIAALGVGGIAVSLGMQDTLSNLIGGLQVSLGKLVQPGDYIEVNDTRGCVQDITWRHTIIQDPTGANHVVPNSVMNKSSIARLGESGLLSVPFQLPVGADIDAFTQRAVAAVEAALPVEGVASRGVTVKFAGEELGMLSGNVVADVRHALCPPSATIDLVSRAIDQAVKQAS